MESTYGSRRSAARGVVLCQGVLGYILAVVVLHIGSSFPDFLAQHEYQSAAMYLMAVVAVALHALLFLQGVLIRRTGAWRILSYTVAATLVIDVGLGAATFTTGASVASFLTFSVIFAPLPLGFLALRPWRSS
jgi:hypothetical protein